MAQRLDQLRSEGKNPDLMRRLARDAQKWTELRSILQDHTDVAQKFIVEYSERYHANQFPIDLQRTVNEFKVDISRRLDQLDQTIRDLLQFVRFSVPLTCVPVMLIPLRNLPGPQLTRPGSQPGWGTTSCYSPTLAYSICHWLSAQ